MNVSNEEVETQQSHAGKAFPYVLSCSDRGGSLEEVIDWLRRSKNELNSRLLEHGTILFRGFPLESDRDFDAFIAALEVPNFRYRDSLSNAVRTNRTERVFTANEAPADVTIYLHHEMAQTPVYPSSLFFFCEQAAETGGATPLCRSDVLLERLRKEVPRFVDDCALKGLRYSNVMPAANDMSSGMGRSWQSTLNCDSKEAAEKRLQELDYTSEWLEAGSLRVTTPVLPALRLLASGREAFFNQLIAAFKGWKDSRNDPSKAITFGDGSPLDKEAVLRAAAIADELSFDVCWQNGDVAWVDNFSTMHGRRSFSGTRKVLASLVATVA
jgi:alpha-ketoglutarate-dependent taurine dioxygenase